MNYNPIGTIHSEHTVLAQIPIQSVYAKGCDGWIDIKPELSEALDDLDGFSHIYLIYHFHRATPFQLKVKPFLQDVFRGVFSTRSQCRPNSIGLSIVELVKRDKNRLVITNVDILDDTQLLDIKPYTTRFDRFEPKRNGWHDEVDEESAQRRGLREYRRSLME